MKLRVLLAALTISCSSLVKSKPVPIPTSSGSNPFVKGDTIPSVSWSTARIKTEPDTYYDDWETKPARDIRNQADQDEKLAITLISTSNKFQDRDRDGPRELAAFFMIRSMTLRFRRSKKLLQEDVGRDEILHVVSMPPAWTFLEHVQLKFIGLYLSQIDRCAAYEFLLHTGNLPPYTDTYILRYNFYSERARQVYQARTSEEIVTMGRFQNNLREVISWHHVVQSCYSEWAKLSDKEIETHVNKITREATSSHLHIVEVLLMRLIKYRRRRIGRMDELKCVRVARSRWPALQIFADSLIHFYGGTFSEGQGDVEVECTYHT